MEKNSQNRLKTKENAKKPGENRANQILNDFSNKIDEIIERRLESKFPAKKPKNKENFEKNHQQISNKPPKTQNFFVNPSNIPQNSEHISLYIGNQNIINQQNPCNNNLLPEDPRFFNFYGNPMAQNNNFAMFPGNFPHNFNNFYNNFGNNPPICQQFPQNNSAFLGNYPINHEIFNYNCVPFGNFPYNLPYYEYHADNNMQNLNNYYNPNQNLEQNREIYHNYQENCENFEGKPFQNQQKPAIFDKKPIKKQENQQYSRKTVENLAISTESTPISRKKWEKTEMFPINPKKAPETHENSSNFQEKAKKAVNFEINFNENYKNSCSLAEMFKDRKQNLLKKMENHKKEHKTIEKKEKLPLSKEEILRQRKEMMKKPEFLQRKPEKSQEKPAEIAIKHNNFFVETKDFQDKKLKNNKGPPVELLERLAMGIKPKVSRKEMYMLTNKKYGDLPEVKKKREEERKRNEMKERIERVKSLEKKMKESRVRNKSSHRGTLNNFV